MNREDIIRMAREADLGFLLNENWLMHEELERFAALVASAERKKAQEEIDTLYEMYKLVCSQRDELMDQQRAQIDAMRGRMQ